MLKKRKTKKFANRPSPGTPSSGSSSVRSKSEGERKKFGAGKNADEKVASSFVTVKQNVGTAAVAKCATNARSEAEKWAKRALEKGAQGLRMEFIGLRRYSPPEMTKTAFDANWEPVRNRYRDVPCQDQYRIILQWPGFDYDYIHANYISTPISEKRFVCTQGPLDSTVVDFWHMVIQEQVENIIMLCNVKEKGMNKCAQYWPENEGETRTWCDIDVTNIKVRAMTPEEQSVSLSTLLVRYHREDKEEEKMVRHYHWVDWPDRGVPACRLTAMVLLSYVRSTKRPIVVHCSAGIGRTGTIVAIEFILERLQSGLPCEAMDEILKEIRKQRPCSIQTDLQYLFVHRVMLFYFVEKYKMFENTPENAEKYKVFVDEYDKATKQFV